MSITIVFSEQKATLPHMSFSLQNRLALLGIYILDGEKSTHLPSPKSHSRVLGRTQLSELLKNVVQIVRDSWLIPAQMSYNQLR